MDTPVCSLVVQAGAEHSNQRFLVHAVAVTEGISVEKDIVRKGTAAQNQGAIEGSRLKIGRLRVAL